MHIPSLEEELAQIIEDAPAITEWARHVTQQVQKVLHRGKQLRMALAVLERIARAECTDAQAEAAETLRQIRELGG